MFQEAIEIYEEAVAKRPSHYAPQSLYNMLGEWTTSNVSQKKEEVYTGRQCTFLLISREQTLLI